MEPLAYLQIARRRWWLIVGFVLAAILLVYFTTPERFVDTYEATHILLVEGDRESGNENSGANPEVVALWAKDDEVLSAAAAELGLGLNTERLSRDLTVTTDRAVDTVAIMAEADDPELAASMANTVAQETVSFLVDRETARQQAIDAELTSREASLRERIAELDAAIDKNPPDVETITAERDALIRQLGEVLEAQDVDTQPVRYTSVEVPERGSKQERPIGTRTRGQRMILAGLVAAVLGFGLAIMLDRSDVRLRTRRGAEEYFGLPVIAEIVAFPMWSRHRRLAVARRPDTAVAESFRTLRSAIMLLGPIQGMTRRHTPPGDPPATNGERSHPPAEVIMITSAGIDDGKTTTVANLAATYGESGQSALVLSFDLKRSKVRASKDKRHPGVSDYLATSSPPPLESLVRDTPVPGVRAVGSGRASRPPGGQFAAQQRLLDEARSLADVVIIDTAPLLSSSIGRELATMVDSVVVLCRVGRTTTADAERVSDLLAQLGAPAVGVVLVGVVAPTASEYFGYFNLRRDRRAVEKKAVEDERAEVPGDWAPPPVDSSAAPAPTEVSAAGSDPDDG